MDASWFFLPTGGYDAVNVWLAGYFCGLPATQSLNIHLECMMANKTVATTELKNCTILRMKCPCHRNL